MRAIPGREHAAWPLLSQGSWKETQRRARVERREADYSCCSRSCRLREERLGRVPSAAGCTFGTDAGRSGGGGVGLSVTACVVDGPTDNGGCALANHMTRMPAVAPTANDVSVVRPASGRRSRTRPIIRGVRIALIEPRSLRTAHRQRGDQTERAPL